MYYSNLIIGSEGDMKKMWKTMNEILNRNKRVESSNCFVNDQGQTSDENMIADNFNNYFSSIPKTLADKLPTGNVNPSSLINNSIPHSFILFPTNIDEVANVFLKLKNVKIRASMIYQMIS